MTDTLVLSDKFNIRHDNILRAVQKCREEFLLNTKYQIQNHLIDSLYYAGAKARQISAEILYRFFILKTYVEGLNDRQIGAIKGYYRKQIRKTE